MKSLSRQLLRWATAPLDRRGPLTASRVCVVLGAPVHADGSLTEVVRERVDAAIDLHRRGCIDRVVFTGLGVRGPAEAPAMAAYALAAGMSELHIDIEAESRTTRENAERCAELLLPAHPQILLISQPFHLRRACWWFSRVGFEPSGYAPEGSVHYRDPVRGWKWTAREYAAWAWTGLRWAARPNSPE